MREYLFEIYRSVTQVSAHEVTAGLLAGLVLAIAASGAWMLARRRVSDPLPMLCGLILVVSAVSMVIGLGHSRYKLNRSSRSLAAYHSAGFQGPSSPIGRRLLDDADSDGDGRLTPEEAARFVEQADRAGKGWADAPDLDRAMPAGSTPRSLQDSPPDASRRSLPRPGI